MKVNIQDRQTYVAASVWAGFLIFEGKKNIGIE